VDFKAFFLKYWDKEAAATRKVIERIPQPRCDYKADPKARSAREIAWLMVVEEIVLGDGMEKGAFAWKDRPLPETMAEILAEYDKQHAAVTETLRRVEPSAWERDVPFMWDGQEVMRSPGYEMAWGFLLDQIHHRGQLSTYLRPMGSTVPAIYGPSADEGA
jgi:uncharacterized damage-inducible protein DinB